MRRACALPAAAAAALAAAAAMEPPTAVGAFIVAGADGEQSADRPACGGSLVVIGADGLAVSLAEALPDGPGPWPVALPGGPATAALLRRGATTTAVLLHVAPLPAGLRPPALRSSRGAVLGSPVWTAGNSFATLEFDGQVALSVGAVSGRYAVAADQPPVRGRQGRELSAYRGPVIELDAAVNDGNQGGAALDADGRLLGLVSLGQARERRLGTAIAWEAIAADLALPAPAEIADPPPPMAAAIERIRPWILAVAMDRPRGPGNPDAVPRPPRTAEDAPGWERKRLRDWWQAYYHQQQVFFTDQPVSALALGGTDLITAATNLHGDAVGGRVLLADGGVPCRVVAIDRHLDLAVLRAERPVAAQPPPLAASPLLGQEVALAGRHGGGEAGLTATIGRIAAVDRRLGQWPAALIQTDCLANYGNLGGVLVDAAGAVAGMLVLLGPDESRMWLINSGVAMAVDAPTLAAAAAALAAGAGRDQPPVVGLGIEVAPAPGREGVFVRRVVPATGAADAGMRAGDVIVALDGRSIADGRALSRALIRKRAGQRVAVGILRAGVREELAVEVREF